MAVQDYSQTQLDGLLAGSYISQDQIDQINQFLIDHNAFADDAQVQFWHTGDPVDPNAEVVYSLDKNPDITLGPNQTLVVPDANVTLHGSADNLIITGDFADTVDATDTTGNLIINTGAGDDTILGGEGHDSMYGGAGDDKIIATDANHSCWTAAAGDDTLRAGDGQFRYAHGRWWRRYAGCG